MGLTVFAQRMKQARENKGLKQNELALVVGVTSVTISSYEKSDTDGNGKKPTLEKALAIAKALDVSLDWLSGLSDNEKKSIIDFNAEDYFKSLLIILLETSSKYLKPDSPNVLQITNPAVITFIQKADALIKIYRDDTLTSDMFEACIEKLLNDYSTGYCVQYDCLLNNREAVQIKDISFGNENTINSTVGQRPVTLIAKK